MTDQRSDARLAYQSDYERVRVAAWIAKKVAATFFYPALITLVAAMLATASEEPLWLAGGTLVSIFVLAGIWDSQRKIPIPQRADYGLDAEGE